MATLESFISDVLPHVPGCPEGIALDAIRNAAIRFCTDTWIVRENLPASDIVIAVDDYTINASIGNTTIGLISFLYDKRELGKKTEEELDIIDSGWRTSDPGVATYVMSPEPNRIKLNRVPLVTTVGGMIVRIATKPDSTTNTVNDLLFNDWRKAIKYGALEELYEIPKKEWSDMKQSIWYGKRFNFLIQSGKARARMGSMTKSTTAQARSWV